VSHVSVQESCNSSHNHEKKEESVEDVEKLESVYIVGANMENSVKIHPKIKSSKIK
jgi:hypothetical protein